MSIYARAARDSDLEGLYSLTKQFTLLNLPSDRNKLKEILSLSKKSFAGEATKEEAEYLFVLEDLQTKRVVGSSKIVAKHGTKEDPHLFYQITKKEKFSKELGTGFIHQILNFKENYDGPTELGGLIVDQAYRGHPEKIGKLISLIRFAYIAAFPERFEEDLHCELAPPLSKDGKSEFWEALGRRFTGLSYEDADRLSHTNKEFIKNLFPENNIYMTLLESKARIVIGEVARETKPAKNLMEKLGFIYKNEIDPFDGGPHLGVKRDVVKPSKSFKEGLLVSSDLVVQQMDKKKLVAGLVEGEFRAISCHLDFDDKKIHLNKEIVKEMGFKEGQNLYLIDFSY